jgi:hypothetical protein
MRKFVCPWPDVVKKATMTVPKGLKPITVLAHAQYALARRTDCRYIQCERRRR